MNEKVLTQEYSRTLFITYDGLLDPLGPSQILPYLYSIADHPRRLHIISFEKSVRHKSSEEKLRAELADKGIDWTPLPFSTQGGKLAKAWDLFCMYTTALKLQRRNDFSIVHCRSYQAMQVGSFLKRWFGVNTIFDMRGLWVDDRVDRGIWPQDKWLYRFLYRHYKRIEKRLLEASDLVVVLTDRVIPEVLDMVPGLKAPISVIPCCADFDHFVGLSAAKKLQVRSNIGIKKDALVISYLGSLGKVYLLDDMLRLFESLARKRSDVHLVIITRDWSEEYEIKLYNMGIADLRDRIFVKSATREEVPSILGASDIMLNFIRPTFSMLACSPTKMAESLAMGIPVISRSGVGDVDSITQDLDAGILFDPDDPRSYKKVAVGLELVLEKSGDDLRERAKKYLGLEIAKQRYRQVYDHLERQQ